MTQWTGGPLSLAQVLEMPALRAGAPTVVAGRSGLGRIVRWVHTTELPDIAPMLRGGDLLLSTGMSLPDDTTGCAAFAQSLVDSHATGLVIELGRRWQELPGPLIDAFTRHELPLVALAREVRFASIAQAVGERIVSEQLRELRESEHVHETFTSLSIAEAGAAEVLETVQRLSGGAVVLENEEHRVMDYRAGPDDVTEFLEDWQTKSRRVQSDQRTTWDLDSGWLVSRIGRRERGWGRLIVQSPHPPTQRLTTIAERAAAALAMHRLHDRSRDSAVRRTHHELVLGLLRDSGDEDVLRRCALAGFPVERRKFTALTLRPVDTATSEEVLASAVHLANRLRAPALVCAIDIDVRVVISLTSASNPEAVVDKLATAVIARHRVLAGAGRIVTKASDIDRTLREASQVVDALRDQPASEQVHRLQDVHLRGLLTLLADDDRLRLFVDRELAPLREYDARHRTRLLEVVSALLRHPTSKSDAAASLHLSRPAFYDRLAVASRVLDADLDDPDIRASLHVALLADELLTLDR